MRRPAVVVLLVALAIDAVVLARGQNSSGDFHVFWAAGGRFARGEPLYLVPPGERAFKYPPFAAMVFQALALLPFPAAAIAFSLLNVALAVIAFRLTRAILAGAHPLGGRAEWPLTVATGLAGQFVLNNLNLLQSNALVFALVLAGVALCLRERPAAAAATFIVAGGMKLTPLIFVLWILIRRTRPAAVGALAATVLVLGLPIALRGTTRGWQDLLDYNHTFLGGFAAGGVDASYLNQNVAALVYRMTQPPANDDRFNYRYLPASPAAARVAYRAAVLVLLGGLIAHLAVLRRRRTPVMALEIASVFLVAHLVSGITFKAHLVTFLFVFATLLSIRPALLPAFWRRMLLAGNALIVLVGTTGREVIGPTAHHYLGGYGVITWSMLAWLLLTIGLVYAVPVAEGMETGK